MATDLRQFLRAPPDEGFAAPAEPQGAPNLDFGETDLSQFLQPGPEEGRPADINSEPFVSSKTEKTIADEFVSGVSSGTDQLQMSLFGLGRLVSRELGIDFLEDFSQRGIERNQAEAALTAPTIQGFTDVDDMSSLIRWAAGSLGNALPSLALAVGMGGVGGLIAKKAVETTLRKSLQDLIIKDLTAAGFTKKQVKAGVARAMSSRAAFTTLRTAMNKGFKRGAIRGAFAGSSAPQTGEAELALTEAGTQSSFTAILAGAAGGVLELLPNLRLISKLFPGLDKAVSKTFVKDFAKGVGIQAVMEGSTEGAQQVIQLAALAYHDPAFEMMDPENIDQVIDAFAAGALVGGVTGGAAEIPGGIRGRLAKPKAEITPEPFDPRDGKDPESVEDFVPADNTLYQEVRERAHRAVEAQIGPAMNRVADTFQQGIDQIARVAPELNEGVGKLVGRAREAHQEFVEGHRHILDDTVRFAREQAAFITDQAQRLTGKERRKFVKEQMAAVTAQAKEVADILRERADQVIESMSGEIAGQGVFDEDQDTRTEDVASEFIFGKTVIRDDDQSSRKITTITEGNEAQSFKDPKTTGRRILRLLRKRFPSATDSTFEIRKQEDGRYLVVLADSGQAPALAEDQAVTETIDKAVLSAARNPDTKRQARIARKDPTGKRKGRTGKTPIDVPTLVFGAQNLGESDMTLDQAFAAMAGRMLDRGIIDNEGFIELQRVFNERFPGKLAKASLSETLARDNRIAELQTKLSDIPQSLLDTPEGQRIVTAQRNELNKLEREATPAGEFRTQREIDEAKTALDPKEIDEIQGTEGDRTDPEADADEAAADLRRRSKPATDTRGRRIKPAKKASKKRALPNKKARASDQLTEKQEKAEEAKKRKAKEGKLRKTIERLEAIPPREVRPSDKKDLANAKDALDKLKLRKILLPAKKVDLGKLNTNDKVSLFMPGASSTVIKAVQEISNRVAKLLSSGKRVRVINEAGAKRMIADNHPHAGHALRMLNLGSEFVILSLPDGIIYILTDNFDNPGQSIVGLLHEFGHAIHFDTWEQLSRGNQEKLIQAFKKDVQSGKRKTGADLNKAGQSAEFDEAQFNLFEFKEWMADQFVDWMNNRRAPRTAIERFLESVAAKMDQLWAFISANPGRFNQFNETYAQFADAVALGLKNDDPSGLNPFFDNEGAAGMPIHILAPLGQGNLVVPKGLSRTEWGDIKKRLTEQYPVIAARAKLITDWIHNAYSLVLAPSTSVMREIGKRIKAANQLVTIFDREEHGKAKKSSNYHQRLNLMRGSFENKYNAIADKMTEPEKSKLLKSLRALDGTENAPKTRQEKELRKLFDEMHDYMIEAGLPVGRINNYFPKTMSRERLIADEKKILKHLRTHMSHDKARSFYNSLISEEADASAALEELQSDEVAMQAPGFKNMRSRTVRGSKFFEAYLDDNLDGIVFNYINHATKRGEFNRFLGAKAPLGAIGGDALSKNQWNSRGKMQGILANAEAQGATAQELKQMKNYVDANLGMFGRDLVSEEFAAKNPKTAAVLRENKGRIRSTMAGIIAYTNLRVLMFTVFASLPDAVGPAIRAGDMGLAFRSAIKNIKSIRTNDNALSDMARAWRIISDSANQHILTEYVDNHFMPPTLRKWNDAFFKWTGLNYYTDFTRKMALSVGIDSVKSEARKVNDRTLTQKQRDRAKQFLAELGLTSENVDQWVTEGERTWGGLGYDADSKNDQKVAEAMVQFVDESIMRPNPAQRPIMASHPAAMLVYHLKGFIYAIHHVVLKRLAHNFAIADTPAQVLLAISPAILMLALTAFGLELRELVTQRPRTNKMDGWEYTWEVTERSGLLGIAQLGWDFNEAGARGQSELVGIGGPAIGHLSDLISKPLSQTIPKSIPLISQLPWARDALRGD